MARGLVSFDRCRLGSADCLIGLDEAGRGALAGPVAAAAVRLERRFFEGRFKFSLCRGVDDSKRLTAEQRARIVARIAERGEGVGITVAVGLSSVEEIEQFNILQATVLAMRRATATLLGESADGLLSLSGAVLPKVLIDGRRMKAFPLDHEGIVGGDRMSFAIALAGIHAKEARDAELRGLCEVHPGYGFSTHKGYGTPEHLAALRSKGPSAVHRSLFIRKPLEAAGQMSAAQQGSLFSE